MKRLALCLLAMAVVPCTAFAQDGPDGEANLNVHVLAADFTGEPCNAAGLVDGQDCSNISHAGVVGPTFLAVVASNINGWVGDGGVGNGINGIQFGVEHAGLTIQTWFPCADQQVPQNDTDGVWPDSGTGNALAWAACQDPGGENITVGIFLVTDGSAGSMSITADPRVGAELAAYTDCDAFTWEILGLNGVDLAGGTEPGCGPIVPTQEKSWGEIKALY